MKDAYSFDINDEEAFFSYNKIFLSYLRTFKRLDLTAIPMAADTGPIGGNLSHEFIILAETGESKIFTDKRIFDVNSDGFDIEKKSLQDLRKKYGNLVRNLWNPFDRNNEKILGCTTVNRLYITPLGDVLVCPYVHNKIGNIFESTLKEIVDYGFSIKYFRNHSDLCLAGEDKEFIKKFMTKSGQTIFKPALAKDIFSQEDFIK